MGLGWRYRGGVGLGFVWPPSSFETALTTNTVHIYFDICFSLRDTRVGRGEERRVGVGTRGLGIGTKRDINHGRLIYYPARVVQLVTPKSHTTDTLGSNPGTSKGKTHFFGFLPPRARSASRKNPQAPLLRLAIGNGVLDNANRRTLVLSNYDAEGTKTYSGI